MSEFKTVNESMNFLVVSKKTWERNLIKFDAAVKSHTW